MVIQSLSFLNKEEVYQSTYHKVRGKIILKDSSECTITYKLNSRGSDHE